MTRSTGDKRYPAWGTEGRITYCTSNQDCYQVQPGADPQSLLTDLWPVKDLVGSPDGARMAFARFRVELADSANVWIADANETSRRMLTHDPGIQYNPAWSPDGDRLAYAGGHGHGTYEIYIVNADGTARRRLTENQAHEFLPAWSPDGRWLAFVSDRSGDFEIWLMRDDGSGARRLTASAGLDTRPAWSPDGRRIAFTTNRTGRLEIWVMNADGTDPQPLEQAEGGACDPAWR